MKRLYPSAVMWSMLGTFGIAFIVLVSGSPVHHGNDPLFWFMSLNVLGLLFLSIVLHNEKQEDDRERLIRLFFLGDSLTIVAFAIYVIWKH